MPEVYGWPEGKLHVYTAAPGTTGAFLAFVQDVTLQGQQQWGRQLSPASARMADRVSYSLQDETVELTCRAYFTGITLFQWYKSATAINADLVLEQGNSLASAAFRCISGRFNGFAVRGQEGGVWEAQLALQFAESSAYFP